MADKSAISWTDATWNCIRGCTRVDEDCQNCYAEILAATRLAGPGGPYEGLAVITQAGQAHWTGRIKLVEHLLDQPLCWRTPRRIFVASMSDPFHEAVPIAWIARMWAVMSLATWHQFQLLTKRPARLYEVLTAPDFYGLVHEAAESFRRTAGARLRRRIADVPVPDPAVAPARHIWLGTSVGSNKAHQRCVDLARVPAGVRMLSLEPLHGPVDEVPIESIQDARTPGWVIVGAESGDPQRVRPMNDDWVRAVRDRCTAAEIAFFFKQRAVNGRKQQHPLLDGVRWEQYPMALAQGTGRL